MWNCAWSRTPLLDLSVDLSVESHSIAGSGRRVARHRRIRVERERERQVELVGERKEGAQRGEGGWYILLGSVHIHGIHCTKYMMRYVSVHSDIWLISRYVNNTQTNG